MSVANLAGLSVLVTRPAHQAAALCEAIGRQAGEPILFPTLEIVPLQAAAYLESVVAQLPSTALAIFTSANAVAYIQADLVKVWPTLSTQLQLISVGPATTQALVAAQLTPVLMPAEQFSSEGILALPIMQQVTGLSVVIFTGEAGRMHLPEILRARNAQVSVVEVYRRVRPKCQPQAVIESLQRGEIDVVLSTSEESLRNLLIMLGVNAQPYLRKVALLVVSERVQAVAHELGWQGKILVANNASDAALLALLNDYARDIGYV
jgi:uroporphyrinogen-III synthase